MTDRSEVAVMLGPITTGRITDLATREALQQIALALILLEERFGKAINSDGVFTSNLPGEIMVDGDLEVDAKFGCNGQAPATQASDAGSATGTDATIIDKLTACVQAHGFMA